MLNCFATRLLRLSPALLLMPLLNGCGSNHTEPTPAKPLEAASDPGLEAARLATPPGMVLLPGGSFLMGNPKIPDARPVHKISVSPFYIDTTEVTNAQWKKFVAATQFKSFAERIPSPEDFPGIAPSNVPPEMLVAGSVVFAPPNHPVPLEDHLKWWSFVAGANWQHPSGPDSNIDGLDDHPVVHLTYDDALAYCEWAGKRLPTEAEWEYASRGGLEQQSFLWGNEKNPKGKRLANIWEGAFPWRNLEIDGYSGSSPVATYPANPYGLYDMAGNVWEWTSDWYHHNTYSMPDRATVNPVGASESFDPQEPHIPKRVTKGGSFLCNDDYCIRYQAGTRGRGDPYTGTNHTGFRCVKDIPKK